MSKNISSSHSLGSAIKSATQEKIDIAQIHVGRKSVVLDCHAKDNLKSTSKEKIHECELCKIRFKYFCHLRTRMKIHAGEKPCISKQASHLQDYGRIYIGAKPYLCPLCPKAFAYHSKIQNPTRIHNDEKTFQCQLCEKKFVSASNLYMHDRNHTGQKQYQCLVCKKTFASLLDLRRHDKFHSGQESFVCDICKETCLESSEL